MKRNAFIVSSYPYNEIRMNVLKECLKSLKHPDFDIILATNYPVNNKELTDYCDYIFYDKLDVKSWVDYDCELHGEGWYLPTDTFKVYTRFDNSYHFDIYRSIYLASSIVSSMGYDFFFYVEGDCELCPEDIEELLKLKDDTLSKGKKMVFFKRDIYDKSRNDAFADDYFDSVIFGGMPSYFHDNFKLPITPEKWVEDNMLTNLAFEMFFYKKFRHLIDDFSLYEVTKLFSFKKIGKLNKRNENGLNTLFYFNKNNEFDVNTYYFIQNEFQDNIVVETYIDDELKFTNNMKNFTLICTPINMEEILNKRVKRVIYLNNGTIFNIIETHFTEDLIKKLKRRNFIEFY